MKNTFKLFVLSILATLTFFSCDDVDDSLNVPKELEIQNFKL